MLGAIYGDVIGSYYEVHCTKDPDFPFQQHSSFTDDSVLIAAVCDTILCNPSDIRPFGFRERAGEYAVRYRQYYSHFPDAGFGKMFSEWAGSGYSRIMHSYANGAAMRVMPIAYAYSDEKEMLRQVRASCYYTHHNREALTGARAVALAVYMAHRGATKAEIRDAVSRISGYDLSAPIESIRCVHVFNSRASYSVPPAIIAFLQSRDYESAVRNAISLGGDADTQACIAGGIAEAFYRDIPDRIKNFCRLRIDHAIRSVAERFEAVYGI